MEDKPKWEVLEGTRCLTKVMLVRKVVCQKGLPINISSQVLDLQVVDWVADKDPRVGCQEVLANQATRMEVVV